MLRRYTVIETSLASRKRLSKAKFSFHPPCLERGKLSTVSTSVWIAGYLGLWYQCRLWMLSGSTQKAGSKDLKVIEWL